jgi:DNA-binding protein YbaB
MKNLGQMLKQAQAMQQRMQEMQAVLEAQEVQGSAGGGCSSRKRRKWWKT